MPDSSNSSEKALDSVDPAFDPANRSTEPILTIKGRWSNSDNFVRSDTLKRMVTYLQGIGEVASTTHFDLLKALLSHDTRGVDLSVFRRDIETIRNYFAGPNYSRLETSWELPDTKIIADSDFIDRVADDCDKTKDGVASIIKETCRRALRAAQVADNNVLYDVDTRPKIAVSELPGSVLQLPPKYVKFASAPVVMYASLTPENDNDTPSNKRTEPFSEIEHNPLDKTLNVKPSDYIGLPLIVGGNFIMVYVNKHKGWAEMESGLAGLFPLAKPEEIVGKKIDGIFVLGDSNAQFSKADKNTLRYDEDTNDYGYFYDRDEDIIVGSVPDLEHFKYFGYAKKPILTLANVIAIERGDFPLHCASNKFRVVFDKEGTPQLDPKKSAVLADDMGFMKLQSEEDGSQSLKFYGTEIGGFACLDGYSDRTRDLLAPTGIGFNLRAGAKTGNARSIVPLGTRDGIEEGNNIDLFLTMNNYSVFPKGDTNVLSLAGGDTEKSKTEAVVDFLKTLRDGRRIAAGSTATKAGEFEDSYYHNPFPLLKILKPNGEDDVVVIPGLYEKFRTLKGKYEGAIKNMVIAGEMKVGVANSQMMTGAGVNLIDLGVAGYLPRDLAKKFHDDMKIKFKEVPEEDRRAKLTEFLDQLSAEYRSKWRSLLKDMMEKEGPKVLAGALEREVLSIARTKREALLAEGLPADEVYVTTVQVGDSRNGKSETLAAMEDMFADRRGKGL